MYFKIRNVNHIIIFNIFTICTVTDAGSVLPGLAGIAHPSDVLDMPVDPNEPTYCLCHQVSYGEMIGCDNTDVSIARSTFNSLFTKFFAL